MSNDPNSTEPQNSKDLSSAAIPIAMDIAFISYEAYADLGMLTKDNNNQLVTDYRPSSNIWTRG